MVKDGFTSDRDYPVRCPACGALTGYPFSVQTVRLKRGHIRIDISCRACQEQWFQEVDIERAVMIEPV